MTVRSNGTGTFYTATSSQQPTPEIMATPGNGGGGSNKKKLSHPPATIHETHQMPSSIEQQQFHHQSPSNLSHPPPPLPTPLPWSMAKAGSANTRGIYRIKIALSSNLLFQSFFVLSPFKGVPKAKFPATLFIHCLLTWST